MKMINGQWKHFAKPSDRTEIIKCCHHLVGHGAQKKTSEKIKEDYYWESISHDVANYIACCQLCQLDKGFFPSTSFELVQPGYSWHNISIDLIGPFPKSTANHKYIIVYIDHLTKWVEANPLRSWSYHCCQIYIGIRHPLEWVSKIFSDQ